MYCGKYIPVLVPVMLVKRGGENLKYKKYMHEGVLHAFVF